MRDEIPQIKNDAMYQLLREEKIGEFNARRSTGEKCDLSGTDLRGLDLRNMDAEDVDLSNSYLRNADIRGLNLSRCRMDGASIRDANISGTYFPKELSAEEIMLSHKYGTRMRCKK